MAPGVPTQAESSTSAILWPPTIPMLEEDHHIAHSAQQDQKQGGQAGSPLASPWDELSRPIHRGSLWGFSTSHELQETSPSQCLADDLYRQRNSETGCTYCSSHIMWKARGGRISTDYMSTIGQKMLLSLIWSTGIFITECLYEQAARRKRHIRVRNALTRLCG